MVTSSTGGGGAIQSHLYSPDLIFSNTVYEREVLGLKDGETEAMVHEELRYHGTEAARKHIATFPRCPQSPPSPRMSTFTIDGNGSSASSSISKSTAPTSTPSRNSKEHSRPHTSPPGSKHRRSLSLVRYDKFIGAVRSKVPIDSLFAVSSATVSENSLMSAFSRSSSTRRRRHPSIFSFRSSRQPSISDECDALPARHSVDTAAYWKPSIGAISAAVRIAEQLPRSDELEKALESESYQAVMKRAIDQGQRFVLFAQKQRSALAWLHGRLKGDIRIRYARRRADLRIKHQIALEQLEERQLECEMTLEESQREEAKNVATAVKWMQRYCDGDELSDGHREITDEDRSRLDQERRHQEKLGMRHESAINVLRGKQEVERNMRLAQHKKELADVEQEMKDELAELEDTAHRLEKLIQRRKDQMEYRWNLVLEIWRKETELEMESNTLQGPLPRIEWPSEWQPDVQFDSALDEYQLLASPRTSPSRSVQSSAFSTPEVNAISAFAPGGTLPLCT